ncbi:MAG TPA: HEAT repeat domain-containing protein [Acidimicrobiia bacterium]|nr:HEAT repeat domain-containing protein [Acidimicrobiia bacterium]
MDTNEVAAVDTNARAAAVAVERDARELGARAVDDPSATVRAVAIAALVRTAPRRLSTPVWRRTAHDTDPLVRRRSAEVAPKLGRAAPCVVLVELLTDADAWVAEAAAYAIGEHPNATRAAIAALVRTASAHTDPLVREAAVAALGAQGDPTTLAAVLAACDDKPAIRRRAVLALAAFDGDEVEARLQRALTDPDWQVRQAAEDLVNVTP